MEEDRFQILLNHVSHIRAERDTQKRMQMLLNLNDSLPENQRIQMPSLITNAYVRRALDLIEDRISRAAMTGNAVTSRAA